MATRKLSKRAIARRHVHNRILVQLLLFVVISLIMFGVVIYDTITQAVNPLWLIGGIIVGLMVGWIAGRIFAIKWHEDTQKVIVNLDKTGIILIVGYVAFRMVSTTIFGEFSHGMALTVLTYSMLSGILMGRGLNMYRSVVTVLKNQKIL